MLIILSVVMNGSYCVLSFFYKICNILYDNYARSVWKIPTRKLFSLTLRLLVESELHNNNK